MQKFQIKLLDKINNCYYSETIEADNWENDSWSLTFFDKDFNLIKGYNRKIVMNFELINT